MNNNGKQSDNLMAFFQGFLRRPRQVGSVIPSSRFLEQRIVKFANINGARLIVELGPGTGGTTRAILRAMGHSARLLSIEINSQFIPILRTINDPRLIVHEGDATQVEGALRRHRLPSPEIVISGIPFSTMKREQGEGVLQSVFGALAPGGRFVAYQVRDRVETLSRSIFGSPDVDFEFRNIPPMRLYRWEKNHESSS